MGCSSRASPPTPSDAGQAAPPRTTTSPLAPTSVSLSRFSIHPQSKSAMADSKNPPEEPPPDYEKAAAAQRGPPAPGRRGPMPLDIPILKHLNSKRVILASASPRRKALLQQVRDFAGTVSTPRP
jgi:septum formation protein